MAWSKPSWQACFHSAPTFGVAGVRESWCWITCSLLEEGHAWDSSMTFEDHVSRSMESTSSAELVSDIASHTRVHVGLTISSYIKQQLKNYSIKLNKISKKCDNTSTINLTKNLIQYSKTKYIKLRHHFIRACSK